MASTDAIDQIEKPRLIAKLLHLLPMTVFWALVAQAVVSVTRILTTVAVGGRFAFLGSEGSSGIGSPEELSLYYAAFGVLTVIISMHEGFVTTPMTVFMSRKAERQSFSGQMLLGSFCLIGLALSLLALWICWRYQFGEEFSPALTVICLVVVLAPLQLLREFSRRWLLANLEVASSARFEILFSLVFLPVLAGLFWFNCISAINAFIAIAIVNVVTLFGWWRLYGGEFSLTFAGGPTQLRENLRFGRWAAAENFCTTLTFFFCVWYLNQELGLVSGGVYSACFNVMLLSNPFLLGVCSLLGARAAQEFTHGGWRGMLKTLTQYGVFVFVVLASFSVVLWFFGADLTNLLFSEKYQQWFDENTAGVNHVTPILGLAVPCLGVAFVCAMALLAIGRPLDNFVSAFVSLILLLTINFSGEPSLQLAAISFVLASASNAVLRMLFLARAYIYRGVLLAEA